MAHLDLVSINRRGPAEKGVQVSTTREKTCRFNAAWATGDTGEAAIDIWNCTKGCGCILRHSECPSNGAWVNVCVLHPYAISAI